MVLKASCLMLRLTCPKAATTQSPSQWWLSCDIRQIHWDYVLLYWSEYSRTPTAKPISYADLMQLCLSAKSLYENLQRNHRFFSYPKNQKAAWNCPCNFLKSHGFRIHLSPFGAQTFLYFLAVLRTSWSKKYTLSNVEIENLTLILSGHCNKMQRALICS